MGLEGEEWKEEKVFNEEIGNEVMIFVDRDDVEEVDEEEWEEEYVVFDLDDIFYGVFVLSDVYIFFVSLILEMIIFFEF